MHKELGKYALDVDDKNKWRNGIQRAPPVIVDAYSISAKSSFEWK